MDAEVWRQAKGVLAEALLCPPNEREALINERCPDLSLRREVQAYLTQYDEHFLEAVLTVSGTLDSTSAAAAAEAETLPDIHNGDHIGPYVVLGRLGVGGMGHVFLGNDTRLQRKVALKCLIASASAAELRARILHEARAAARITHPNIAIVHDVIEHANRPFLVMEYVEGENLAALIKRGRPSIETIVTFLRQLASALAAAHAKGIVHRDLKPANIQVTPEGSVKILDFGVAHAMSAAASLTAAEDATTSAGLTVGVTTGTLQADRRVMHPGTPAYMSPEQMFGRPIDQRSDIYSLGVIVYEMATGHRPYSTDDPLEVVLTLSRNFLNPGEARADLPAQINGVISKMLSVRPEDRYQTAGALESAVAALVTPDSVAAPTAGRSLWSRVARLAVSAAAVPVVVGFIGFVTNTAYNVELDRPAGFGDEPVRMWLSLGFGSLLTPVLVYIVPSLVGLWALRFLFRLLRLSNRVEQLVTSSKTQGERLGVRLGLRDPVVLGQAVAACGLVALAAILWFCWDVLNAVTIVAPVKPDLARVTLPLVLGHNARAHDYRMLLTLLVLALSVGAFRIARMRQRTGRGLSALVVVVMLLVVAMALAEVPYRFMWRNNAERVVHGEDRCYVIGERPDDLLLFCPDATPHRNRIVGRTDPALRQTGTVESIFTPRETPR